MKKQNNCKQGTSYCKSIVKQKKLEITDKVGLKMVEQLKKHIRKNWGNKCKEYQYACTVCDLYLAINILETIFT